MNNCRITPCSIFSNLPSQSFIPLNLPYWIHDHLTKAMDRQQVTGLTLLDLSTAFDTIDNSILLDRLASLPELVYATVLSLDSSHIYPTGPYLSPD